MARKWGSNLWEAMGLKIVWPDHAENGMEGTDSLPGSQPIGAGARV